MTLHIVVTAKQVLDPETPLSAFRIESNSVSATGNMAPVINGYDEQAVEAALRVKETHGDAQVTVLSCGTDFALDVIKKPLAMGADALVLLQDAAFDELGRPHGGGRGAHCRHPQAGRRRYGYIGSAGERLG